MNWKQLASNAFHGLRLGLATVALFQFSVGTPITSAQTADNSGNTTSPVKHVIVIIGENRTFDHIFATYKPVRKGATVWNLLSQGIVNADGTPGPNFSKAQQLAATDMAPDAFLLSPPNKTEFPNNVLPAPLAGGPTTPGFATAADAAIAENGLEPQDYGRLATGGTGLKSGTPDTRIANVTSLPAGPFQLTPGVPYSAYAASPVHRFYQMWQQFDCSITQISESNPTGCDAKLFPWVEVSIGAGTNGAAQPSGFNDQSTREGSTAMGFYNVQQGDAHYMKALADNYAMSDNFHQSVQGGTGANHIMLGHGDAIWFSDSNGNAMVPPHNVEVFQGTIDQGIVDEIENPDPQPGTNNWYTQDGYGGGSFGSGPSFGGGSYSNCSDPTQPGVAGVVTYLQSLPHPVDPHCEVGHYYLLNNYNPGYFGDGSNAFTDTNANNTPFTVPPSSTPSIGDSLIANNISWKYYADQWNNYLTDKYQLNYFPNGAATDEYCNICNPFQYDTSIMTHPDLVAAHLQDTANLYSDIQNGTLPAVSFVKPSGLVDGHPASSKLDLFEGFTKKIVEMVRASSSWHDTAIFITFDEGGGYYDSGYVQPLDFFGDGTRIPLMVVSPYVRGGVISHSYADHVSIVKFINRNWKLAPVSFRSRDNYPNPIVDPKNPYVPLNGPALSDLWDLFVFGGCCG